MMTRPKLTLYVDIISPFNYLAFHVIRNNPIFKSCEVHYVPVLLGGIMKACNNTPPIKIKNKDKWINNDRLRWAKRFNIPVSATSPEGFPHNTVSCMRALTHLQLSAPDKLPAAIAELYQTYWVETNQIDQAEVWGAALVKALGESEAKNAIDSIGQAEVKQQLIKNTEQALADGAFGMPYMMATNAKGETEGFWGFDHLGLLIEHLGLEKKGGELRALL